jgi:phage terminase large subunit
VTAPAAAPAPTNPATAAFLEFLDRYQFDWVALVREQLGAEPDEKQIAVLTAVCRGERRISIVSGHGVGKTTTLAWCIVCFALTRFPQKTVCTAPTSAQLFDALAAETKSWFKRLPPALQTLFELKSESIHLAAAPEESFVSFRTSRAETPEALAGVHSANVLLIADEASGVPEQVFEAAAGSMSGHTATTVLAGNPVRTSGLFFDTHHKLREVWTTFQISCVGHPRISPDFVADMAGRYGEDSNAFRVRVLGLFPKADDDTVIPYELAQSALQRDVKPALVQPIWGVDCARFGSDTSALAKRRGNVLMAPIEEKAGYDTMQVAGWVKHEYDTTPPSDRPSEICVDVIGIGAGVTDRLRELGLPARGINVGEAPVVFNDQFLNLRAELWFKGRDWLAALDCHLAGDEKLVAELVAPKYKFTSNGKKQVESKDDMKKRGFKSPNRADAFLLTLASEAISAAGGSKQSTSWSKPLRRGIKGII